MGIKILNDYVCINEADSFFAEDNIIEDVLDQEDKKNSKKRKRNVRKAIDKYLERRRLKQQLTDFDLHDLR